MYTVYHGSWRDFTTAVGVSGKVLAGKCWRESVRLASLTRHTLRLWALTRPSAQPTVPCQGKGKGRAITYEQLFICRACSNKLTTANLCDRKKNAEVCAMML